MMTEKSLQAVMKEFAELASERKALEDKKAELDERYNTLKAKLALNVGTKGELTIGKYTAKTWTSTRQDVDAKRLAKEMPEVFEEYKKPATVTQFARVTIAPAKGSVAANK